ncbi:hypothetical protein AVEN_35852-1 [Araneus ventricosus]|uniref:Uncharacterized protein n=1 Tax=Araneus ventricosus TaxID=182803 RepID=A0A4Y2BL20_ARAVE|nr:hypothetical protein AVEN_35852-1 [Araneus ventricosus]
MFFSHSLPGGTSDMESNVSGCGVASCRVYQVLVDDEIIADAIDDQGPCDNEEDSNYNALAEKRLSSEEDLHCPQMAMKWLEQQEKCDAVQLLS